MQSKAKTNAKLHAGNEKESLGQVLYRVFIGIIFGLYPANKAAKMKPIDALHYGG